MSAIINEGIDAGKTERQAAYDKFRRSVGFQFGFVMYSGLSTAKAIDHIVASAEKLIERLRELEGSERMEGG